MENPTAAACEHFSVKSNILYINEQNKKWTEFLWRGCLFQVSRNEIIVINNNDFDYYYAHNCAGFARNKKIQIQTCEFCSLCEPIH